MSSRAPDHDASDRKARCAGNHRTHPVQKPAVGTGSPLRANLVSILIVDPHDSTPEFDVQVYTYLGWSGFAIPLGRSVGEWAWVGRVV